MSKLFKVLLTLAVVAIIGFPAMAADYYVMPGAGGAADVAGNDGSMAEPFVTITYAISRAGANDNIYVDYNGGTEYNERVVVPTGHNNLRIEGINGQPIIDGTGAVPATTLSVGFLLKSDNVTVRNFGIRDFTAATDPDDFFSNNEAGAGVSEDGGTTGHVLNLLDIQGCNWGIYLNGTANVTITECFIGDLAKPIAMLAGTGGVGIKILSNGVTIEKNIIGSQLVPADGNTISYCEDDGIWIGSDVDDTEKSADQSVIGYNTFSNIGRNDGGTSAYGFAINLNRIKNTVNVVENTMTECANGLHIIGPCLDLNVANNTFTDCGSANSGFNTTEIIIAAYNDGAADADNYGDTYLWDIWKNNGNIFEQDFGGTYYKNSAASVEATSNVILKSDDILGNLAGGAPLNSADYKIIRNTIQSVWDNDVITGNRLGVRGGSDGTYIYHEDLVFAGINDVDIFGEDDNNPSYTVIEQQAGTTCGGALTAAAAVYLNADELEFHGFTVNGLTPASDVFSVNILMNGNLTNIHHNAINVTNTSYSFGTSCQSIGIANLDFASGSNEIDGSVITMNTFGEYNGTWTPADEDGYYGIYFNHFNNTEVNANGDVEVTENTIGGMVKAGIWISNGDVDVTSNTVTTGLLDDADGTTDDGEGFLGIAVFEAVDNIDQDNVTLMCNTVMGAVAGTNGFTAGIIFGDGGGQVLTNMSATSNIIDDCYNGVEVNIDANAIALNENDLGGPYGNAALVNADGVNTLDAENNWWGSISGPGHTTNTYNIPDQGELITGLVDFVPWWGAAPTVACPLTSTSTNVGPVTLRLNTDESLVEYYTSIQTAIDAATGTEGIIWVTAGTYTEAIDINNAFVLSLKGKKLNGVADSYTPGTPGAFSEAPLLIYDGATTTMVTWSIDEVTMQGFILDGKSDAAITSVVEINGIPIDNATFQYNTVYIGDADFGINITGTNGITNSTITRNLFIGNDDGSNGAGPAWATSFWLNIHSNGVALNGGYSEVLDVSYNDVSFGTARVALSAAGDISDLTFNRNTFSNTRGAILAGVDEDDPSDHLGGTVIQTLSITNNIFNDGPFADEYAFMLWNAANAGDMEAVVDADFNAGDLTDITINYNQILMDDTGLNEAVTINGTTNTLTGEIDAQHNWWRTQYGPRVKALATSMTALNSFWDDAGDGALTWNIQRSSWNQAMQESTCDNEGVDFFPWWQANIGPDYNGPISLTEGGSTTYYPTFWDASTASTDAVPSLIQAVAGTYTEDFGVWNDDCEIAGPSDADPSLAIIQATNTGLVTEDAVGIFLQNPAGPVDGINIHGFTLRGPDPVTNEFAYNVYTNGSNISLHDCAFEITNNDGAYSFGIVNGDGSYTPATTVEGLTVYNNTFTQQGTGPGYQGIMLNYEATGGWGDDVEIYDNMFGDDVYTGVTLDISNVVVRGNTFSTTLDRGANNLVAAGEAAAAILVNDFSGNGVADVLISCNTIRGYDFATDGDGFVKGIYFPDLQGGGDFTNIEVKNNTFMDCWSGVYVEQDDDQILVNRNNFAANFGDAASNGGAIFNADGALGLDGTNNFFGTTFGPTHASNAYGVGFQGAEISDDVTYVPFWSDWTNQCPGDANGTQVYPIRVYDAAGGPAGGGALQGSFASFTAAINDGNTDAGEFVYAVAGTFTEDVTALAEDLSFESTGTTQITGNLTLINTTDYTMIDPYIINGNLTFPGGVNQSSIIIEDSNFELTGTLSGNSAPGGASLTNFLRTNGTGYFVRSGISSGADVIFPLNAPSASTYPYFFATKVKINKVGVTNARIYARVNGENPATTFSTGTISNPVLNTWFMMAKDEADVDIVNPDADVFYYYDNVLSHPAEFSSVVGSEVEGCWDPAEVKRNAFGARWDGTAWESQRANSPAVTGNQCKIEHVNTFSPWGVFWGYSDAPLVSVPDHSTNLQFIGVGTDFLKVRVARGTGSRFMIVVKPDEETALDCWNGYPCDPQEYPIDGVDYQLVPYSVSTDPTNASYGTGFALGTNGAKVVYISDGTSLPDALRQVKITGLSHGTKYFVQVIEANGIGQGVNYNVSDWCPGAAGPNNNGRYRMTIPIVGLAFRVGHGSESPELGNSILKHGCDSWGAAIDGDFLQVSGSGEQPWNVKYSDGNSTIDQGLVYAASPYFSPDDNGSITTTSATYSLVLVKDSQGRLCNTVGTPVIMVHEATTYDTPVDVSACILTDPDIYIGVSGTDATFIRWEYNDGNGWLTVTNPLPSGTATSISSGTLTLTSVQLVDDGTQFRSVYSGAFYCGDAAEVTSDPLTLNVFQGVDGGDLASSPAVPVCPAVAVQLTLQNHLGTTWTWQRSTDGGGSYSDIAGYVNTTLTTYTIPSGDVTEANGKAGDPGQYMYKVIVSQPGCGDDESTVFELEVFQTPEDWAGNDANITSPANGQNSVSLAWDAMAGATSYRVNVYTTGGALLYSNLTTTTNSITVGPPTNPLAIKTEYDFTVTAVNDCANTNTESIKARYGTENPTIVLIPGSPSNDFGNVNVGTASAAWAYDVEGSDLSTDAVLTLPAGDDFEVRFDIGGGFSTWSTGPISIDYTFLNGGGTADVEIRFAPQAANSYVNAQVSHTSTNATTVYALVSGVGIDASPSTQAENFRFADQDDANNEIDMTVTRGNGDGTMIVVNTDNSWPTPAQISNVSYSAGDNIVGTNYVIFFGDGGVADLNDLTLNDYDFTDHPGVTTGTTNFYVRAYEYNDLGAGIYAYKHDVATYNPDFPRFLVFTTNPTTPQESGVAFPVEVTAYYRDRTTAYVPGANYTIDIDVNTGTATTLATSPATPQIQTGTGTTGSVNVTWTEGDGSANSSLVAEDPAATPRFFPGYSDQFDVVPTPPTVQARTINFIGFRNCGGGTVDVRIRWTNGNGAHRLLVVRQGSSPTTPVDDVLYFDAQGDYEDGSIETLQNDGASYVVDRIDDYNPNALGDQWIDNMPGNQTFYFQIYEYNGNATNLTRYLTSTASFNPRSRRLPNCKAGSGDFYVDADNYLVNSYNKQAFLSWDTYVEQGIVGFEVSRANEDGEFKQVGSYQSDKELQGALNSYSTRNYNFVDDDSRLVVGNEYLYLLTAVAVDGSRYDVAEQFVTIQSLTNPNAAFEIANVKPTPAVDYVSFDLNVTSDMNIAIEVMDVTGKIVKTINSNSYNAGSHEITLDLGNLASGTYMLHVNAGSSFAIHRFVIQK